MQHSTIGINNAQYWQEAHDRRALFIGHVSTVTFRINRRHEATESRSHVIDIQLLQITPGVYWTRPRLLCWKSLQLHLGWKRLYSTRSCCQRRNGGIKRQLRLIAFRNVNVVKLQCWLLSESLPWQLSVLKMFNEAFSIENLYSPQRVA